MSKRQLLVEYDSGFAIPHNIKNLVMEAGIKLPPATLLIENGKYYMNALLQRAEVENKNGRIYPMSILKREFNRIMVNIGAGNAIGECDHPEESVVSLKNNPHRIIDMWWNGNDLYGRLEILVSRGYRENGIVSNMIGDTIATYIQDYGINIGISSRGVGTLKNIRGKNYVDDDFELICWDLVHSPSTHNAYLYNEKPLKFENKDKGDKVIVENNTIKSKYKIFI